MKENKYRLFYYSIKLIYNFDLRHDIHNQVLTFLKPQIDFKAILYFFLFNIQPIYIIVVNLVYDFLLVINVLFKLIKTLIKKFKRVFLK